MLPFDLPDAVYFDYVGCGECGGHDGAGRAKIERWVALLGWKVSSNRCEFSGRVAGEVAGLDDRVTDSDYTR